MQWKNQIACHVRLFCMVFNADAPKWVLCSGYEGTEQVHQPSCNSRSGWFKDCIGLI